MVTFSSRQRYNSWIAWTVIALLLLSCGILNHFVYPTQDISWAIEVAGRILKGGHYMTDFVEVDPPLIFYIYTLPLFISRLFHLSLVDSVILFNLFIAIVSLLLTHYVLKRYLPLRAWTRLILLISCAINYTFLFGDQLGQRECMTIMLVVPYLLLMAAYLDNLSFSTLGRVVISSLAAIGFCIKPHFFIAFFLVEFYVLLRKRSFILIFTLENIIIVSITIVYCLLMVLFTPAYIFQMVPRAWGIYYLIFQEPWLSNAFAVIENLLIYLTAFLYLPFRSRLSKPMIGDILLLGTIGFWLAFVTQKTIWLYHLLPALALTFNLLSFLFIDLLTTSKTKLNRLIALGLGLLLFGAYLFQCIDQARISFLPFKIPVWQQMIDLTKKYASHQYLASLSDHPAPVLPLTMLTQSHSSLRFICLQTLSTIFRPDFPKSKQDEERHFLQKTITEDFTKHPPRLVFVNTCMYFSSEKNKAFDYIQFFSEDPKFKKIWQHYCYLTQLGRFKVYLSCK